MRGTFVGCDGAGNDTRVIVRISFLTGIAVTESLLTQGSCSESDGPPAAAWHMGEGSYLEAEFSPVTKPDVTQGSAEKQSSRRKQ